MSARKAGLQISHGWKKWISYSSLRRCNVSSFGIPHAPHRPRSAVFRSHSSSNCSWHSLQVHVHKAVQRGSLACWHSSAILCKRVGNPLCVYQQRIYPAGEARKRNRGIIRAESILKRFVQNYNTAVLDEMGTRCVSYHKLNRRIRLDKAL